ncbi:MAG: helix-turn-helix domain-containing protein [Actinomycetaceae bacterium]|nr:helix-turn-helix domain-containing protein [Actinomycetaceae bacterium]
MSSRFETQDRLIAATRRIIVEDGIEATSVERICKVAGFSRGAFYSNFSSKDSLLAALAEDEYAALISRLRATVEEWAARPELTGEDASDVRPALLMENLLSEALEAIRVNRHLYVLHSELLMRSIRDTQWGERLLDINVEFVEELGKVLGWILDAAGRRPNRPMRAITHAVIGIVMRASGVVAWRETTRARLAETRTAWDSVPSLAGTAPASAEETLARHTSDPAAQEVLETILLVLHGGSEAVEGSA